MLKEHKELQALIERGIVLAARLAKRGAAVENIYGALRSAADQNRARVVELAALEKPAAPDGPRP